MVVSILENTTNHGAIDVKTQTKQVRFYNLYAIISVGYRVNSQKAAKFIIGATDIGYRSTNEQLKILGVKI